MKVLAFVCLLTMTHAQNDDGKMDKFLKDVLKTMTNINKIEKTYIPEEEKEHDSEKDLEGMWESNYEGQTAPRKRSHQRNFHDHRNLGRYELHKSIHSKKYKSRGPQKHVGYTMDEINTYKSKMPKHHRNKFRKQNHRYHPKESREYDYGEMKRLRRAIAKRPGVSFEDEEDDISSQDNEDKLRGNANPEQISFKSNQVSEIPLKSNEFSPYENNSPFRTYSDNENDHTSTQNSNVNFQLDPYDSKGIKYDKRHSGSEPFLGKEKVRETGYTEDYPHVVSMFDDNTFKKEDTTYLPVHDISKVSGNLQYPLSSTKDPLQVKDDLRGIKLFISNSIPEQEKENLQKIQELPSVTISPIDTDNLHGGQIVSLDIGLAEVKNGIQDTYGDVREHSRKIRNKNYWTELVNDLILQYRNKRAKKSISRIDKNNKKIISKRKFYEMRLTNSTHPNKRQVTTNEIYRVFPMQYNEEQEIQGIMRKEPRLNPQNEISIHGTKMKSKKRTIFSSGNERKAVNKLKSFKQACSNDEKGFQVNIIKPMIVEVKYPGLTDTFNDHYVYERSTDYNKDHPGSREGSNRFESDIPKKSISEGKSYNGETIALSENTVLKKETSRDKREVSESTERETPQSKRDVSRSANLIENGSKQNGSSLASGELRFKKEILQNGGNKLYEDGIETGRKGRKLLSEDEKDISAFSSKTQEETYKGKAILSGLETIWKPNQNKSDEGKNKRIEKSTAKINSGSVSPIATTIISNKENPQYVENHQSHSSEKQQELKNKNIIETSLKLQPEKLKSNTEEHLKDSSTNSLTSHLKNPNKDGIAELLNNFPKIIETKPMKEEETIVSSQVTEKEDKRSLPKDSLENVGNHLLEKKGASVDEYSNQKRVDEEDDDLKGKAVSFQNNRNEYNSPAINEGKNKVDRYGIDKNSEEDIFSNLIKEKDNSPQLTNSFNGVESELLMDIPKTSTEAENSVKRDTNLLGQWEENKISATKNSNSVQSRSANFTFPEAIKRLFDRPSNDAKKPGAVSKVFKTNLKDSVKNPFSEPIRELSKSNNQYQRQFSQSSFKSLPHMIPSGLTKSDNEIQHETSGFKVLGSFQQSPSELLKSNNRIQSQFSENNIFDKSAKKSTKPDYLFHGFLFPGTKDKNSIGQSSGTLIKSDNQIQGIIKSDDQFHSKASGYTEWNDESDNARSPDRKNNIYPTLQNNRDNSNEGNNGISNSATYPGANINSTMGGQQKMSNLRISPSEYSDVSQMRPTISGDLASEILDDIFVKVNSSIPTKHHIGDALSKTDYSSMNSHEAGSSEINYKLEEEDYRTRCTKVLQEVSRLIQCLIAQEVKKKSCITLEPDLQDFLSWLLEPESTRESLYSDQDNFLFNRNENYENEVHNEGKNKEENEDESDEDTEDDTEDAEDTEDTEESDECQECKKDKCRLPHCGRCECCRNVKRKARAQDIDHGIKQLNSLLSEYDRLSNYEKSKLEDLQGLLSKKLVELHSFLRTDTPVDEGFYEEFNDENYLSNEANMRHEIQKYHQPIAHKDFAQYRRLNTPEPTHDNEIQKSEEKSTTESVSDSKLIEEQLVKLGLHPGKTKNVLFNPTSEPTEEYEQLARKVDEYRRKRRVMYH